MGKRLHNKPLVEAIFELRWGNMIPPDQFDDPNYQILVGLLFERFKEAGYEYYERLPTAAIPDQLSGHVVQHRFRTAKDQWPLIQVGKGILTVNDTDNYDWDKSFFTRCVDALTALHDKYPGNFHEIPFHSMTLKYIDAHELDYEQTDLFDFLQQKMGLDIRIPEKLLNKARLSGSPKSFAADFGYEIPDLNANLRFRLARGARVSEEIDLLIWETEVRSIKDSIPRDLPEISRWLTAAHQITSDWFFKLIEGDLEEEFS
jgi:uncharacterized protein (TIGR04255 family)